MDPRVKEALEANPDKFDADVIIEFNLRAVVQKHYLGEVSIFCSKCHLPIMLDKEQGWLSCCGQGVVVKELET